MPPFESTRRNPLSFAPAVRSYRADRSGPTGRADRSGPTGFLSDDGAQDAFDSVYSSWVRLRVEYIAPVLQFLADACIVLFLIQSVDRIILCLGCFWISSRGLSLS